MGWNSITGMPCIYYGQLHTVLEFQLKDTQVSDLDFMPLERML